MSEADALHVACTAAAILILAAAALHDLAARTVPNRLPTILALAGLGLAALRGDLPLSLAALFGVFAFACLLWLRGLMGGGDVKLLAATSLLVTPDRVGLLLAAVAVAGGVLCLPYLPGRRLFRTPSPAGRKSGRLQRVWRCERRRLSRRGPLPYAVAIAAGTLSLMIGS